MITAAWEKLLKTTARQFSDRVSKPICVDYEVIAPTRFFSKFHLVSTLFYIVVGIEASFWGQLKISLTRVNIDANNWETNTANRSLTSVGPPGVYVWKKGLKFESNRQHEEDSWRVAKRDQLFQPRSTLIFFWHSCSRLFRISLVFHNHFHHLSQRVEKEWTEDDDRDALMGAGAD